MFLRRAHEEKICEKGNLGSVNVPESLVLKPCFAPVEFRSRSACSASLMGSWFLYSADMMSMSFASRKLGLFVVVQVKQKYDPIRGLGLSQ